MGEQVAPFSQVQLFVQFSPYVPCGQVFRHCSTLEKEGETYIIRDLTTRDEYAINWTLIDIYFVTVKTGLALTLARDVMATSSAVTIAALGTILAPETLRASIRADCTLQQICRAYQLTLSRNRISRSISRHVPSSQLYSSNRRS